MKPFVWVAVGFVTACAKPQDAAPMPQPQPQATPPATPPAGANVIALARFPETEGVKSLACEDLCGKPDRAPECPGTKVVGEGSLALKGLAGKVVRASVGAQTFEPREEGGVKIWDKLPAGTVDIAAGDAAYACVPIRPGQRTELDAAKLLNVHPEPPACAGGTGVIDGNMAEFEYVATPFPRAVVIGANGCRSVLDVSTYGPFKAFHLPAGVYLVRSKLDEFGMEVAVPEGGTVSADLAPLEAEMRRREERRQECKCPTDYKKR